MRDSSCRQSRWVCRTCQQSGHRTKSTASSRCGLERHASALHAIKNLGPSVERLLSRPAVAMLFSALWSGTAQRADLRVQG